MNERIDELIFQVGYTKLSYPDDNFLDGRYALTQEQLDKFAELIVRDVISIVEGYCETSPEIYGLPLEILEHFDMELKDV